MKHMFLSSGAKVVLLELTHLKGIFRVLLWLKKAYYASKCIRFQGEVRFIPVAIELIYLIYFRADVLRLLTFATNVT